MTLTRTRFAAGALQKAKGKPLLRVPLVAGALVLEFEAEADRDQVVDVLTPLMKRAAGAAHPGDATGRGAEAPGPLSAAKQQLLGEDGYALPSVRGICACQACGRTEAAAARAQGPAAALPAAGAGRRA